MREDVELICTQSAERRRVQEDGRWKLLLYRLLMAECGRREKRKELLKQYRWELAAVRVGRFLLLVMSAGLVWMEAVKWAASGVLVAALLLLIELDLQGKIEDLRRNKGC